MVQLLSGDLLPDLSATSEPETGQRTGLASSITERLAAALEQCEAPGINTLVGGKTAMVWQEALGANVLDAEGRRFIDMTAGFGVAAAGHRHPAIVSAICSQAEQLVHGLADVYAHPRRIELAQRLCHLCREAGAATDPRVYFAVSGADAVEIALKTAQLKTGRSKLLAFDPGYHGMTLGALEATSREGFRSPFEARFARLLTRLPFACETAAVEQELSAGTLAAVIVEPIVGREGVVVPPPGWLAELSHLCRRHGTLLIVDEIFTGFGRTGELFAHQHDGATADLICCGKALAGGLPIGVVIGEATTLAAWDRGGEALHTGTFVAHPLSCAAATAFLDLYQELDLAQLAAAAGARMQPKIERICQGSDAVVEVRGRGLLWGIELQNSEQAARLSRRLLEKGVIALSGGPEGTVVQLCPPLTVTPSQLDFTIGAIAECLAT